MDATASIAAAASGLKPVRFIIGIVSQPSTMTLATAEPGDGAEQARGHDRDLAGAARAGPPAMALARFMKNCPAPDFSRKAPKMMNRITYEAATPSGMPKSPSVVKNVWSMRIS